MAAGPTATVVGGGIAGLACAAALARAGWRVTVLERAPAFGEVGAGVAVTRNGMTALDALGLGDTIRRTGYPTFTGGFLDRRGRWLLRLPDTRTDPRAATTIWGIHRQRLHAALREAAESAGAELVTGADVVAVRPGDARGEAAAVTWQAGSGTRSAESDLVVGADGVRSTVRERLAPGARPRYSGSTCWRAVLTHDGVGSDHLVEFWGPGGEFGAMPIGEKQVYWFGYVRQPEGAAFADELGAARERFAGWTPPVREVLAATTPGELMRHDVHYLPDGPASYVSGRVVLVGDAAHACLPTVGQGVSLAVEDGVSLGRLRRRPSLVQGRAGRRARRIRPGPPPALPAHRAAVGGHRPLRPRPRRRLAADAPEHRRPADPGRRRGEGRGRDRGLDPASRARGTCASALTVRIACPGSAAPAGSWSRPWPGARRASP